MSPFHSPIPDSVRLRAVVLDGSNAPAFIVDLDGVVRSWNEAAVDLLGYGPQTTPGRRVGSLLAGDQADGFDRVLERISAGEVVRDFATRVVGSDGRTMRAVLDVSPVEDADGVIVGAATLVRLDRPVTSERAMQIADARWRALIDAAVDGMIVIDANGSIEAFNPAAERLFGYGADEVLGENVRLLMPSGDRERHDQYLRRYLETGVRKIIGIGRDVIAVRRDGATFPVRLSVGELRVEQERHFVGIVHDLTARVALEQRVRDQASMARLGEMAAVLAHEVKNPLAAVRGAIQVLGRRYASEGRDAEVVKAILGRLDGLNELMQDLLLFARTPAPKRVATGLRQLLTATAALLAEDPAMARVQINVAGEAPPIAVDPALLTIAFHNVIVNAAQAQGEGEIEVRLAVVDGGQRVTIRDHGPGMAPEAMARLFQPFFTTKARGTGLGLATVRSLVEAHGGEVRVGAPEDGGGTSVTIELPTAPARNDELVNEQAG